MGKMVHRGRPIQAEVQPLSLFGASRLGESSTSTKRADDVAFASTALWWKLGQATSGSSERQTVFVSIQWPEDRRLRGKGKARNLVVQVQHASDDIRDYGSNKVLHLPVQLLPRCFDIPLQATLYLHRPVRLSTAILQPISGVTTSDPSTVDPTDLDLSEIIQNPKQQPPNGHTPNGHYGDECEAKPPIIWREGHNIVIRARRTGQHTPFRIAMLEPAAQGHLTPETRIIVSAAPYDADAGEEDDHVDGILEGASSHGKTHISLSSFDPDSFLSSSLDAALWPLLSDAVEADGDLAQSLSSTSGSVTPRPPGTQLPAPPSPPVPVDSLLEVDEGESLGTLFTAVQAMGPGTSGAEKDVCWVSVGGLGQAGIFEGDWVYLRAVSEQPSGGRIVKVLAWERLDEDDEEDMPVNPILIPPTLFRSLFDSTLLKGSHDVRLQATPFGARTPTMPVARSMTVCRVATTEGVDKRYERSWLRGLRTLFEPRNLRLADDDSSEPLQRVVRRGDTFAVPVWRSTPVGIGDQEDSDSESDEESDDTTSGRATGLVYFKVTALSYEPLVPLEDDFRSSVSSKARSGELGCWVDVGEEGQTQLVLEGMVRDRIASRDAENAWHNIARVPPPYDRVAEARLRDLLHSCVSRLVLTSALQMSVLIKGARGSGKKALLSYIAEDVGFNVFRVDCYDVVGESHAVTEGNLSAQLEKAISASPSILLLDHIEALAKRSESSATGRTPLIVKFVEGLLRQAKEKSATSGWPIVVAGTVVDEDAVPGDLLAVFKQDITLSAPDESQRLSIVQEAFASSRLAPDVQARSIATQTAALQAGDIKALAQRAADMAFQRAARDAQDIEAVLQAGLSITSADITSALTDARASYSDSIGAPKIPNVSWDDIGGLQAIKDDILDTIQLPLQHPELFAEGLKKRSGILLYGPPGTGKTLLAKAVATSCSLNFFSVKGPELLNMYIGESEANVRRVFQRARDASPCVVFMDELDSVAPKRGNQGDSGGVMDRIVSQLLAELDGMSSGGGNTQVYVLGATNRPDLLDPALLRPGRFDRMLYLSVPTSHTEQLSILQALTRKFKLDPSLDLQEISEMCPFNYTGADFYALCSDAMLKAMTRAADRVDRIVADLNVDPQGCTFPKPLTVQYYLSTMASKDDVDVKVGRDDFVEALKAMKPSVSESEMKHYERVQQEFKGFSIGGGK